MHPDALNSELAKDPFVPLRIHLSDGRIVEVFNPRLTFIAGTSFYIYEPGRGNNGRSRIVASREPNVIALRHIVSIEPITPAAA